MVEWIIDFLPNLKLSRIFDENEIQTNIRGSEMNELLLLCTEKMYILCLTMITMYDKEKITAHQDNQDKTYSDKEKSCLKEEPTKYILLEKFKKEDIPGPFTNEDEIKRYLLHQVDDDTKHKHMYGKIRYARISFMSLKPTAAVFHLKRNHKNLTTEECAEVLTAYLSNACCCEIITVEDLNNVMRGIMS